LQREQVIQWRPRHGGSNARRAENVNMRCHVGERKKKEKEKKKGDKHIAAHLSGIRARARVCIAFASSFINLWSMRPWRASHI